jgi:predicted amidohydrolase
MLKKIGVLQFESIPCDKKANLEKLDNLLARYDSQLDIVLLPELFDIGFSLENISEKLVDLAEPILGNTTGNLGLLAKKYQAAIIANTIEKDEEIQGRFYDTSFIVDQNGEFLGKYRKVFVYPKERFYFSPGRDYPVFDISGLKVGMSICYDHAFPELYRILALKGAQLITISSAVPYNYEHLIHVRTRARAQDNQLFVAAANSVGKYNENESGFCGNSMVVGPRGNVIARLDDEKDKMLYCTIDTDEILNERLKEPSLREEKLIDFYKDELNKDI